MVAFVEAGKIDTDMKGMVDGIDVLVEVEVGNGMTIETLVIDVVFEIGVAVFGVEVEKIDIDLEIVT